MTTRGTRGIAIIIIMLRVGSALAFSATRHPAFRRSQQQAATTRLFASKVEQPAAAAALQDNDSSQVQVADDPFANLSDEIRSFPVKLQDKLAKRGVTSLLPIQSASFQHIQAGNDAVLHAPTGSGKTLAYVLPLAAAAVAAKKPKIQQRAKDIAVSPYIVTLLPSRELAKQVGKEWAKYYKTASSVATVFGGVPIERHTSILKKGADVVVSTPGRLRELVREGHLDYSKIKVVVIDEADMLLDTADSPDVQAILDDITTAVGDRADDPEYQLLLVSATVNDYVRNFAMEIMEIPMESESFIQVEGDESRILPGSNNNILPDSDKTTTKRPPLVEHWMTPVASKMYPSVTCDLISTLSPRLCIIFVPTKADTETVAAFLSNKISSASNVVRVLHGDMAQSQRSRTINLIRETQHDTQNQILVATDVASRGLDLPNVDLVVQFGIPRVAGKEATYNVELYTHRTGRAGRVTQQAKQGVATAPANSVVLYDVASGEGKLVADVVAQVKSTLGIQIRSKPIPSTTDIVEAGYRRALDELLLGDNSNNNKAAGDNDLVSYVRSRLLADDRVNVADPEELLNHLCTALISLSKLDPSTAPQEQRCSLITGDPADRTLLVYREDGEAVSPTEATKFCKKFGSGKLGRIMVTKIGSAVLDLPTNRAKKLLQNVQSGHEKELSGWRIEECQSLPEFK
jgi:superfamily II DNA/RNA helicase